MIATTRFVSANYVGAHKLYSAFTIAPSQLEENIDVELYSIIKQVIKDNLDKFFVYGYI